MSDNEHYNDEFERFFREKAKNYDIPFRENDWKNLEKRLELRDLQISYRRKLFLILAASVLIAALLGYFTYQNHIQITELNQQLAIEVPAMPQESEISGPGVPDQQTPTTTIPDREAQPLPLPDFKGTRLTAETPDARDIMARDLQSETVHHVKDGLATHLKHAAIPEINFKADIQKLRHPQPTYAVFQDDLLPKDKHEPTQDFFEDTEPVSGRVFSAGLLFSPELSTAGSVSNFHDPGFRAGLSIEYDLNQKFAISAGAVFSNVRYAARQENYSPPEYFTTLTTDRMIAECQIIDIPIGISYTLYRSDRARFFSSASLSSYIMLNEDYFFYDEQSNNPVIQLNERSGRVYWLSNAGFSLGYEHKISSNVSLRAEPFIKVPLREVGWGNVRLYSMGSFFSIQYRI